MGTDRWAYQSRLRRVDPLPKLILSLTALVVCLCCGSGAVGLATAAAMGVLIAALGGLPPRVYLHFLKIPMAFLAVGCATMLVRSYPAGAPVLAALPVGGRLWGFDGAALAAAAALFFRAMGAVGAMYFLALNTPVTDLTMCLGRLHVPRLLVELMELIYRFIFVLSETAGSIRTAQASRLGYQGLRRSLSSLGTMASLVFLRAWRRADRIYAALESRGYAGSLTTLPGDYAPGRGLYPLALAVAAGQLAVLFAERGVLG
ncbi:MAG TPA: cobalt ECF transporter T component CbiQ [Candidatus Flavonifractor avistercoris]|nr:cobalt ECF transporter T component CbiQ [Candidatus Flavonifractor avistercoris]